MLNSDKFGIWLARSAVALFVLVAILAVVR